MRDCTGITIGDLKYPQIPIYASVGPCKLHGGTSGQPWKSVVAVGTILLAAVTVEHKDLAVHSYYSIIAVLQLLLFLVLVHTALPGALYLSDLGKGRSILLYGLHQIGHIKVGHTDRNYGSIYIRSFSGDLYATSLLAVAALVGAYYHALQGGSYGLLSLIYIIRRGLCSIPQHGI